MPSETEILLYIALLPAIVLLAYVYSKDKVEKEPMRLILRLFGFGALAGPIAAIAETLLFGVFEAIMPIKVVLLILEYFIGVALVEEGLKYLFLSTIRKNPEFNFVFDGVVYAVAVTLGFAALENVLYVFTYGLNTAIMRALLSVPGHCAYGVIMGCFFGLARHREISGNASEAKMYYWLALILPVIAHGFFDAGISSGSNAVIIIALGVQVAIIIAAMILVHKLSKIDKPIYPQGNQPSTPQQGQAPSQAYPPRQMQFPQQQMQAQVPQQQWQQQQTQAQQQRSQAQVPPQQWQSQQQSQAQVPRQQAQVPPQQWRPQQQSQIPQQQGQVPPQQMQMPQQQWQAPSPQWQTPQQAQTQMPQQTQTPQQGQPRQN